MPPGEKCELAMLLVVGLLHFAPILGFNIKSRKIDRVSEGDCLPLVVWGSQTREESENEQGRRCDLLRRAGERAMRLVAERRASERWPGTGRSPLHAGPEEDSRMRNE